MNPDVFTRWLEAPATLPNDAVISNAVRYWPWFVPARILEAARDHQQHPYSEKVLSRLQLYSNNWLLAYSLLAQKAAIDDEVLVAEMPAAMPESVQEEAALPPEIEAVPAEEPLIQPLYTEDYFRHQGIEVSDEEPQIPEQEPPEPQTLMVVMSFAEWLAHFKTKSQREQEEAQEKSALRSMWQREKLAAAMEDEPEEIPEDVFEMAVSSITKEDDIASESLAKIYEQQEKWSAAAEMYRKLALKYPSKSTYFASRAEAAKKRLL